MSKSKIYRETLKKDYKVVISNKIDITKSVDQLINIKEDMLEMTAIFNSVENKHKIRVAELHSSLMQAREKLEAV